MCSTQNAVNTVVGGEGREVPRDKRKLPQEKKLIRRDRKKSQLIHEDMSQSTIDSAIAAEIVCDREK